MALMVYSGNVFCTHMAHNTQAREKQTAAQSKASLASLAAPELYLAEMTNKMELMTLPNAKKSYWKWPKERKFQITSAKARLRHGMQYLSRETTPQERGGRCLLDLK